METSPETSATEPAASVEPAMASPWQIFWQRLRRQRIALAGGVILILLYLVSILAGFIAPYSYERQDRDRFFLRPTALRFEGLRLAVQRYESKPGSFKYEAIKGEVKPIHFFVRGDRYQFLGLF